MLSILVGGGAKRQRLAIESVLNKYQQAMKVGSQVPREPLRTCEHALITDDYVTSHNIITLIHKILLLYSLYY